MTGWDRYHTRLLVFLSVATFFEGYDFMALTQLLPSVRADLGLSVSQSGYLLAFINIGTVAAYLLIRRADRIGRRRLLMITIAGYTILTAASGLAYSKWDFALFQFGARIFLIAEWAVSMVLAAEEFPAERRGTAIGVIQASSSMGAIVCAGVVPLLLETQLSWRSVYLVGIVPLVMIAYARRGLRESARFAALQEHERRPIGYVLTTPYRRRVLQLALIWGVMYVCAQNAVTFWKEFAVAERGLSDRQVGLAITIAAVGSLPPLFFVGRFLDLVGRRVGAMAIFPMLGMGCMLAYRLEGFVALTAALVIAIFAVSAVLPVMNALTAELFPTDLRSDAFAWANNLLGRIGYVLSPMLITQLAESAGFSMAMTVASAAPLVALALILRWIPETGGRELEDTSALH